MEVVQVGLPISFGRPLFLKCYEKSHSQLLLCVGPEREKPTRLEVLFKDVVYIGLREETPNASLRFASGDEEGVIQSTVAPFNWRGR
ncbi:hypothetical protein EDD29_5923 [Actinocorallia herbida]|uniref:Uncharacterized protein n=1 Tax=Actinocorallia herbida TaxID=58109 RepID=A0A3N1D435_9ACTN|nr:hypothetical protein [Actinocorallia herbida]ROO88260.1 hypothetical protein EDD29_5923 [Actinocorallia herbida]